MRTASSTSWPNADEKPPVGCHYIGNPMLSESAYNQGVQLYPWTANACRPRWTDMPSSCRRRTWRFRNTGRTWCAGCGSSCSSLRGTAGARDFPFGRRAATASPSTALVAVSQATSRPLFAIALAKRYGRGYGLGSARSPDSAHRGGRAAPRVLAVPGRARTAGRATTSTSTSSASNASSPRP